MITIHIVALGVLSALFVAITVESHGHRTATYLAGGLTVWFALYLGLPTTTHIALVALAARGIATVRFSPQPGSRATAPAAVRPVTTAPAAMRHEDAA